MQVIVRLFGSLRRAAPAGQTEVSLTLEPDSSVAAAIVQLQLDEGEVGLVVVNGAVVEDDTALHDGDRVELFAVMAGG